jgi:hypothetical protein
MGWTAPRTWTVGEVLTAGNLNTHLRDQLLYLKSGAGASVGTSETTNSTTYVALATPGPAVTLTTDVAAWVALYANLASDTGNSIALMGFNISGATTVAAADVYALGYQAYTANAKSVGNTAWFLVTGLTAGSNTFTAVYRAGSGTMTAAARRVYIQPA